RKEEFKRALSCSTMHDIFNLLTVLILLPIELSTRYLERTAGFLAECFSNVSGVYLQSPLKIIINPAIKFADNLFLNIFGLETKAGSICMLILSLFILFTSLFHVVKIMKSLVVKRTEVVLNKILGGNPVLVMTMGMLFTAIIQSSSVTTSILVPIVASGIISMEAAFPITLGANVGTTITAILASLTGNVAGITIAFAHLLFNITGILIIYPLRAMRAVPLSLARKIGELSYRKKRYAFIYVFGIFFLLPGLIIFISRMIK
ncbi:MAG: Na/Pi symporter, partial [Candidatus Omnitrophota bacterium]|nr:Na/Pi symporter [Candidatus Omnitrophota bacterium]